MPLNGKVALITGGSRGIGAEIARQLSAEGARIFLAANDTDDMFETVVRQCREQSAAAEVTYGRFDFLEEGSSAGVVPAAMAAFGRIDILVNNAAIRVRRPFGEFSAKEFDQVVAVNLRAPFLISQEVVPIMKANGAGRIINIASQMGSIAEQNLALYGLTKAALIHLTMSMAFELAPINIMVNAVSPGPTMTEYNVERTRQHPDYLAHKLQYLPSGRYCRPDEIAEVVRFLATTRASNIQGHNLVVDGGYVIH
jgi:NAD(P)-dependent dehydrogenase (short-subunit alcohol dehydrogenase family)